MAKATDMFYTYERGVIDMPDASESIPIKGPLTKCILPCSTILGKDGVKLVFGLSPSRVTSLVNKNAVYCFSNTIISNMGISRLFAGCECDADKLDELHDEMVLNQKVYKPIAGDNLLDMPSEVFFVNSGKKMEGMHY